MTTISFNEVISTIRNRIIKEIENKDGKLKAISDVNGENTIGLHLALFFQTNNGRLEYQFDDMYEIGDGIKERITKIINEEA